MTSPTLSGEVPRVSEFSSGCVIELGDIAALRCAS